MFSAALTSGSTLSGVQGGLNVNSMFTLFIPGIFSIVSFISLYRKSA